MFIYVACTQFLYPTGTYVHSLYALTVDGEQKTMTAREEMRQYRRWLTLLHDRKMTAGYIAEKEELQQSDAG